MNKSEFMYSLNFSLREFPQKEREDIIYDYEEHFAAGLESGKNEEEICRELGDPVAIARQYKASISIERASFNPTARNIFSAVMASLGLGLLNLIFVLGPFIAVASVLFALFVTSCAITFSGVVVTFSIILKQIVPQYINLPTFIPWSSITLYGIGLTALGLLCYIGITGLSKLFFKGTLKYLKMNINIITGRR